MTRAEAKRYLFLFSQRVCLMLVTAKSEFALWITSVELALAFQDVLERIIGTAEPWLPNTRNLGVAEPMKNEPNATNSNNGRIIIHGINTPPPQEVV